jgi:hypothetical protein
LQSIKSVHETGAKLKKYSIFDVQYSIFFI